MSGDLVVIENTGRAAALLTGMDVSSVVGLRDRAIIAVMTYSFARVSADVRLVVEDYLTNGGRIEVAQRMAGHSSAKTTGLYDRRNDDVNVGEVERIGI
jgi:site-specific recombinase XerD